MADTETPTSSSAEEFGSIEINGNSYHSVTIRLSRPLFLGGQSVAEVIMREPTAQDLIAADEEAGKDGGSFRRSVAILSRTIQLPPNEIGKMPAADFLALDRRLDRFLGSGR